MVEPLDHYRANADAPVEPGVYRVVGRDDDRVTLLRVAEDGRRVHGGVVVHLDRDALADLAPAGDPDAGLGRLRQAPKNLAAHPLAAGAALLAVVGGEYLRVAEGVGPAVITVGAGLVALWLLAR